MNIYIIYYIGYNIFYISATFNNYFTNNTIKRETYLYLY